jgi:hypothetical protein
MRFVPETFRLARLLNIGLERPFTTAQASPFSTADDNVGMPFHVRHLPPPPAKKSWVTGALGRIAIELDDSGVSNRFYEP